MNQKKSKLRIFAIAFVLIASVVAMGYLCYSQYRQIRINSLINSTEGSDDYLDGHISRDGKWFLSIQQAGFDMLMGNKDRKENPSNFVVVQHPNGMVKPVNMDYGRCLFDKKNSPHLKTGMWSKNQENN